jgi:ABC-type transport system involved in multi-copper enzyme maturation permease subunit
MTNALKAELRSMRASRAVMLAALIPAVIAALIVLVDRQTKLTGLLQAETVVLSLGMLIAGAVAGGSEYQHRTIEWTLLGTPRRRTAAAAKLVAAMLLGVCAAAVTLAVTWALASIVDPGIQVNVPAATLIVGQLALGALTCAFGLACGLALRSLPAAVGAVLMIALVLPIIFQVKKSLDHVVEFLPYGELSAAALALGSSPASVGSQLPALAAGVVLIAWTALIATIALTRLTTTDT